jgi:hypothetical protein
MPPVMAGYLRARKGFGNRKNRWAASRRFASGELRGSADSVPAPGLECQCFLRHTGQAFGAGRKCGVGHPVFAGASELIKI